MSSPAASSTSSPAATHLEMKSLTDLVSTSPVAPGRPPPLRKVASLDDFSMTTTAYESTVPCQIGIMKVPRLRFLGHLSKRVGIAFTSLLRRRRRRRDSPGTPSLDSSRDLKPGQVQKLALLASYSVDEAGSDIDDGLDDGLEDVDSHSDDESPPLVPSDLTYDPVAHADVNPHAHLYITQEVFDYMWHKFYEAAWPWYDEPTREEWLAVVDFYHELMRAARVDLPASPELEHSLDTLAMLIAESVFYSKPSV